MFYIDIMSQDAVCHMFMELAHAVWQPAEQMEELPALLQLLLWTIGCRNACQYILLNLW